MRACGFLHRAAAGRDAALRAPVRLGGSNHDRATARRIVSTAHAEGQRHLVGNAARALLDAYGIPTVQSHFAATSQAVAAACAEIPAPYVLKIVCPDLPHKSDVGGVAMGLVDAEAARRAAEAMIARIGVEHSAAQILGFDIEPTVVLPGATELFVGVADDPVFGPVLAVGAGGKAVEILQDRALELPPLDDDLARGMIARTRVAAMLAGYRDVPAACVDGVVAVLEAVAAMVEDLPELRELDINPLLVGHDRVIALDARIRIAPEAAPCRMAIRPMPIEWTADLKTRSGLALHVRPVRPDDEALLADFFHRVSPEDLRFRFLTALRDVGRDRLVAMTQVDYARTMHFLAFAEGTLVASAMLACDGDHDHAEVALSVAAGMKGRGISWTLMQHVLAYARAEGIETIESLESAANRSALSLEGQQGFVDVSGDGAERIVRRRIDA